MKNIFKHRKIFIISMLSLICVFALTLLLIKNNNKESSDPRFRAYTGYYDSTQTPIGYRTLSNEEQYQKMNTIYDSSGAIITKKAGITIDSNIPIAIENELDFYAFIRLSNADDNFLTYKYVLFNNIDMNKLSFNATEVRPIGYNGKTFSGEFDGLGHTIANLSFDPVDNSNTYKNTHYYALFRANSGIIKDFGIINLNISIGQTVATDENSDGIYYIANIVGLNEGTVSYVFLRDNIKNELKETPGIQTISVDGYHIAGLVAKNNGTFNNSYYAVSTVYSNNSGKPAEFQEIMLTGNAPTNTYYYNSLITNVNGNSITYGGFLDKTFNYTTHYGTYCQYLDSSDDETNNKQSNLNYIVSNYNNSLWFTSQRYANYGNLSTILTNIVTPVTRGLNTTDISYDSNTDSYEITINNTKEYSYIMELFDVNSKFASNSFTYLINADINMDNVLTPKYNNGIAATFKTKDANNSTQASNYKGFYINNFDYSIVSTGIRGFGVFPYLTGTVEYLNFYVGTSSNSTTFNSSTDSTIKAIGAIAGIVEGGTINKCNVFTNLIIDNNIGHYYVGSAVGMLSGEAEISNIVTTGTLSNKNAPANYTTTVGYMDASSLSGVVGYVDVSTASVSDLYSNVNIESTNFTGKELVIAGVIGAGYFFKATNLENVGSITNTGAYSKLYTSGVIARVLGINDQISYFTNNGDISITQSNAPTYIAGVLNADLDSNSNLKLKSARYFYASCLTNGANISVTNQNTNTFMYTDVINVLNANGFITKLSGLYNLNYRFSSDSTPLGAQSINVNYVNRFAPILMTNNTSQSNNYVELYTSYNLRDITLTQAGSISSDITYTGNTLGNYINYIDVRNEGNITFNITSTINGNIKLLGVFDELSSTNVARSIYNGGNINVNYTVNIVGNIFASGICYANRNGFTDEEIELYNPNNDKFDKTKVGSIDKCINNGSIEVTSSNFENLTYAYDNVMSANNVTITERHFRLNSAPSCNLKGTIAITGIAIINESVITNTFNIGDMFAANYINDTKRNEINASGLVTYNVGKYAIIENSANDGTIRAINLSQYFVFSNGQSSYNITTAQYAFVNTSGIVCYNDEYLNNGVPTVGTTNNSKQVIAFTINYGTIYSYNIARNSTTSSAANFRTVSAGILGQGLLNIINVVNYGNIYGSEVSGGIVGSMFFTNFSTEVTSANKVTFANTINYAKVLVIDKGELEHTNAESGSSYSYQTYDSFKVLNGRTSNCIYISIPVYSKDYFNGSIFGIINFSGSTNANNVIIRYLISFNEDVSIVGAEAQTPSTVTVDLSTFYSAYLDYTDGIYSIDKYIGQNIVYSPLSTGRETINGESYYGVFNDKFPFKEAVAGNGEHLDINNYQTDVFITDYFEFVGVLYVNPLLLDSIGWGVLAYNSAADTFATRLQDISVYISYLNNNDSTNYNDLVSNALNTDTWLGKCDQETLLEIVKELIQNEENSELLAMIEYVFTSSSNSYSLITTEARTNILESLIENDTSISYSTLLDVIVTYNNNYSQVLADNILTNTEAGQYILDYISSLSNASKETILTTYCNYLKDSNTNAYFNYSTSKMLRYNILCAIFENIDDNDFYNSLANILNIDLSNITLSDQTLMYNGYTHMNENEILALYKAILLYTDNDFVTYLTTMSDDINYYVNLISSGYFKTSLTAIYNDVAITKTSNIATNELDERVALWNQIRTTEVFKKYLYLKIGNEYIAKATEFNNTYQTTTYPYEQANYSNGDLSFTYTFNITPATYFLGPYKSEAKDMISLSTPLIQQDVAPTNNLTVDPNSRDRTVIDVMTKEEADYLYNNGYTYSYQLFYYEYSDSSSNNQFAAVQKSTDTGEYGKYAFTWFKTPITTDFSGGFLSGSYDENDNWTPGSIVITDANNETFDANGGGISLFTSSSNSPTSGNYTSYNGNTLALDGYWTITDVNNKQHRMEGTCKDWADFIIAHEIRHYVAYPTDKLHPSWFTGLMKRRGSDRWLRWLSSGEYVKSSQYIDYNVEQLLALDGYLTSYEDGKTISADERDIINTLFNTRFVNTVANQNEFKNVIAAALLEKNSQINNDSYYYVGLPEFNYTNRIYYRLNANIATSYNSNTKYYQRVEEDGHYNYLEVDSSKVNNTNYSSYYTLTATRVYDYYNYNDCYEMKESDGYNMDIINNFFINNIYSSKTINNSIPFEYLHYTITNNVKAYLTTAADEKVKYDFISYCSENQSSYAKLLLELMRINTLNITSINYPVNIGDSTDPNSILISNISSYDDLRVVNTSNTIDQNQYSYGYTFTNINLRLDESYDKLYLYVAPTQGNQTFNYSIDGGTANTVTVNNPMIVEIDLNNNQNISLSSNQNIILYSVSANSSSELESYSYYVLNEEPTQSVPGNLIYKLPTMEDIIQIRDDIGYENLPVNSVEITIKSRNFDSSGDAHTKYHQIVIDEDGNINTPDDVTIIATSPVPYNINGVFDCPVILNESHLGKYVGLKVSANKNSATNFTYSTLTKNQNPKAYRHQLYQIKATIYFGIEENRIVSLINFDSAYSTSLIKNNLTDEEKCVNSLKNVTNYSTRYNNLLDDAITGLIPIDYSPTINNPTHSGIASKNIIEILGLSETHISDNDYCVSCLIKKLITSSNEAFKSFITSVVSISDKCTSDYEIILNQLVKDVGYNILNDAITNQSSTLSQETKELIAAAYLTTDYKTIVTNNTNRYDSILNSYISNLVTDYQYINNDISDPYDKDKFVEFCHLIGYNLSTAGYGIYALASNQGKLNGEFIPDNLNLDELDPEYETDNDVLFKLIAPTESYETSASWRGGEDDDSDIESVNYAFYDEMKQLVKSISTVVFELTLESNDEEYYGDIDLDNNTITFYVTEFVENSEYSVKHIDLAHLAKAYDDKLIAYDISKDEFVDGFDFEIEDKDEVGHQFTVFAEDKTVHRTYDIIFKELTTNLTMEYDTLKTSGASLNSLTVSSSSVDTRIVLNITTSDNKLPKGFNLKPYLSFVGNGETYLMNTEYLTISSLSSDHRIKDDGSAVATIVVSYKIPAGTYAVTLNICGESVSVTYIKQSSSQKGLTIKFNNNDLVFSNNNQHIQSNILFGRAYNKIELEDYEGNYSNYYNYYLDSYTLSSNATMTVSASKSLSADIIYNFDANTSISYKKTTYTITYVVRAEDGSENTYYHDLVELDPFVTNDIYGSVFGDGLPIQNINTTFSLDSNHDNQSLVTFERGSGLYYRIKYDTTNIYTLGSDIEYEAEETTVDTDIKGIATFNKEYRGISVDVNDNCDAGTYSFVYRYTNKQYWDITINNGNVVLDTPTTISYTFPRLVVVKTYSTDATLHSMYLIDAYKAYSTSSTAMTATKVLRPISGTEEGEEAIEATEQYYQELINNSSSPINVGRDKIDYMNDGQTDYSDVLYKDYFAVGAVSNAQLSNYAPTFDINNYGLMFQTTTLEKLTHYGKGVQTDTDMEVLTNHDTTFLYVPFTYVSDGKTKNKVFLIELDTTTKTLTNVYEDKEVPTSQNVLATFNKSLDDIRKLKLDDNSMMPTITISGVTYTLSRVVGDKTNNPSLYMDYIGNPLDNHFWYVSYVVFSEDYVRSTRLDYIKFYHIALIDLTNNVYFDITVITPNDSIYANMDDLYFTLKGYRYTSEGNTVVEQIDNVSTYVGNKVEIEGNKLQFTVLYSIQLMPSAYYLFYLDLPGGYECEATINADKVNTNDYLNHLEDYYEADSNRPDPYLPPSSIVVQRVGVTIEVKASTGSEQSYWAITTSSMYVRNATLKNSKLPVEEDD